MLRISIPVLILAMCGFVRAQEPDSPSPPIFRSQSDLVVLHVNVLDGKSDAIPQLPRSAFQVYEEGVPQEITVEGKVSEGSVAADGRATFSGTASLDWGDGAPPLPSVAFTVTAAADGVVLKIDSITLPAATLTAGAVTIE